jgi:hypothetical protein
LFFVEVRAARVHQRVFVQAGIAGSMLARPFPVPGDRGLVSFPLRGNEARWTN